MVAEIKQLLRDWKCYFHRDNCDCWKSKRSHLENI